MNKSLLLIIVLACLSGVGKGQSQFKVKTSYPQSQIFAGYGATCFSGGCSYTMDVTIPPLVTITKVLVTFHFQTLGSCNLSQGAWDMTLGSCRWPENGGFRDCPINIPGLCQTDTLPCNSLIPCFPSMSCDSQTVPLILNFYRCVQPGAGCSFSCIAAAHDWEITLVGIRDTSVSVSMDTSYTICPGTPVLLTPKVQGGKAPITYKWSPTGETTGSITVSPVNTTTYSVVVTDCSGDSSQATTTVNVLPPGSPGYEINIEMDSVFSICPGDAIVITPQVSGGIGAYDYTWYPGESHQPDLNVSPATATTYTLVVTDCNGDTATAFTTVNIYPDDNPGFIFYPDSACENTMVDFFGQGSSPQSSYDWILSGALTNFINDQKIFTAIFPNAGLYNVILNWTNPLNGCTFTEVKQITIKSCVGVEEATLNQIQIYPNPSNGFIYILSSTSIGTVHAELYNMLGERITSAVIQDADLKKGYPLNTNAADGIYQLVLRSGNTVMNRKICIVH